jgi:hypothetical protein
MTDANLFEDQAEPIIDPKLKRAQSLVGTSEGRPEHDFYPTPPAASEALLRVEKFSKMVWEPACGDGAISKVLEAHGHVVTSTDLIDRGYGEAPHDFMTSPYMAANVITNPPFTLAEQFVTLALRRTTEKVAILGKLQFLEGAQRRKMFESTPLKKVWVFSKRLSLTRDGKKMKNSGMIAFAWYVWEHGYQGQPTIGWI